MYHAVSKSSGDSKGLTISVEKLEEQWAYLVENGYKTYHFSELETFAKNGNLPKKAVIITFDDVYVNQLENAYPLLQKYNLKATFFIPFDYVGGLDVWNTQNETIMSVKDLKSLDSDMVELGVHSFHHGNYASMSIEEVQTDLEKCKAFIDTHDLNVHNILAYPYGKYPKKNPEKSQFFKCLNEQGIGYGLRIGNRINAFPFKNNYEIQRIDMKGEDSLSKFKLKLKFGKRMLF